MKLRHELSAAEIEALWVSLAQRLESVGLETQPAVACKIIDLVNSPGAGLRDFADTIKADPALSGRLLKLANSAFFAQRSPISSLDRACVLLGLERLKGVSLGFYLARGTATDGTLSKRIWGESVYRACLMSELARSICPALAPEAFVVGLMMDAGTPFLAGWLGHSAREIIDSGDTPTRQHQRELNELPYTHTDVSVALTRQWKLPAILAQPIERHHTAPPTRAAAPEADPIQTIWRLGHYVGSLRLGPVPADAKPLDIMGRSLLGMTSESLGGATRRAALEYSAMREMFTEVAASVGDLMNLSESIHRQLVAFSDGLISEQLRHETQAPGLDLAVGQQRLEVRLEADDSCSAYLYDTLGRRLVSHTFNPRQEAAKDVLQALGIDNASDTTIADLDRYLKAA